MSNFVFYESWIETLNGFEEDFGKDFAMEAAYALVHMATTGEVRTSKKSIINWITGSCMPNIQSAQQRYEKAVENGKKGGRPSTIDKNTVIELHQQGRTQKEIAEEVGCSDRNVRKILKAELTGTNLEKDIEKDKDKEIEVEKETEIETVSQNLRDDFEEDTTATTTTTTSFANALSSVTAATQDNRYFTGDTIKNLLRLFGKDKFYDEQKPKYLSYINKIFGDVDNNTINLITCYLISLRLRNRAIKRTSTSNGFGYWVIDALHYTKDNKILNHYKLNIMEEIENEHQLLDVPKDNQPANINNDYVDDDDDDGFPF